MYYITRHAQVLVLDAGRVAEFGAPRELAARDSGAFAALLTQQRATRAVVAAPTRAVGEGTAAPSSS